MSRCSVDRYVWLFSRATRKERSITLMTSGVRGLSGGLLAGLGNGSLDLFECVHDVVVGDIERAQRLRGNALVLLGEREQQMLGTHFI